MKNLGGKIEKVFLNSHIAETCLKLYTVDDTSQGKALRTLYNLGNHKEIWNLSKTVISNRAWALLANTALNAFDIKFATRIYRQMGNAGMVMNLERIGMIEDRLELSGHISVLFNNFAFAKQCFSTSNPKELLYLNIDLGDFEDAL
jgi:WD repeat-containing protein 19